MTVGPLAGPPAEVSSKLSNAETGAQTFPPRTGTASPAAAETVRTQEDTASREAPKVYQSPQDVVEVHQDSEVKDQFVVDYLDQGGHVILQVPSSEELNVERGIAQEIEQTAKQRIAPAAAAIEGDKSHGN